MKKIIRNLLGMYLALKNDNSKILLSKEKIEDKLKNFPTWMQKQIDEDFENFSNKSRHLDVHSDGTHPNRTHPDVVYSNRAQYRDGIHPERSQLNDHLSESHLVKNRDETHPNETHLDEAYSDENHHDWDIDKTIENFERLGFLKKAQLVKIKIKNNKFEYQNFLPIKYHPRFIKLKNFFKTASKVIKFPDIEFLYSIHDSFDKIEWLECLQSPIFCISKLKGNKKVILFPHIEWMQKNDLLINSICKAALHCNWNNKINKAFWRGGITGFEDLNKNERFKIVKFATQYPDFFDAALSDISSNKKNKKTTIHLFKKEKLLPYEQLKYKYLLAIDGHAFAGSFFWQLFSNSVILKNQSNYLEWYYNKLNKNEHYIEFTNEKNLLEKIMFLNQNENLAKTIIKNANNFANEYLTNETILVYIYKLLEKYSKFIEKIKIDKSFN